MFGNLMWIALASLLVSAQPATHEVARDVRLRAGGAWISGTLYAPGPGRHAALILVPGAGAAGHKDPGFAPVNQRIRQPLIDHGFAVLVYDKPGTGESSGPLAASIEDEARAGVDRPQFDHRGSSMHVRPPAQTASRYRPIRQ